MLPGNSIIVFLNHEFWIRLILYETNWMPIVYASLNDLMENLTICNFEHIWAIDILLKKAVFVYSFIIFV